MRPQTEDNRKVSGLTGVGPTSPSLVRSLRAHLCTTHDIQCQPQPTLPVQAAPHPHPWSHRLSLPTIAPPPPPLTPLPSRPRSEIPFPNPSLQGLAQVQGQHEDLKYCFEPSATAPSCRLGTSWGTSCRAPPHPLQEAQPGPGPGPARGRPSPRRLATDDATLCGVCLCVRFCKRTLEIDSTFSIHSETERREDFGALGTGPGRKPVLGAWRLGAPLATTPPHPPSRAQPPVAAPGSAPGCVACGSGRELRSAMSHVCARAPVSLQAADSPGGLRSTISPQRPVALLPQAGFISEGP